jgi:hypothetical protein
MQLRKPEAYVADFGRVLPPEEAEVVAQEVTHISRIVSKSCKRESANRVYPRHVGRN